MSYSRFMDSNWYSYPSDSKVIECILCGGESFQWHPNESFESFLNKVGKHCSADELAELKEILLKNMQDIDAWFKKWK